MPLKEISELYHNYNLNLIEFEKSIMNFKSEYNLNDIHFETKPLFSIIGIKVTCKSEEVNNIWLIHSELFTEKFNLKLIDCEIFKKFTFNKVYNIYTYEYTFKESKYYEELKTSDIYE